MTEVNSNISPQGIGKRKNLWDFKSLKLSGDVVRDQILFQKFPESYNGAVRDKYVWTQTHNDLDVRIFVDANVNSSKCIEVSLKTKTISVKDKQNNEIVMSGELFADIRVEDSTWSLIPKDHIHINLEKKQPRMWLSVLKNEAPISIKNLELSQNIEELAEEEQATVERLMYDQGQEAKGLPTSQQREMETKLKEAWNKPGSPFIGQPFDMSKIHLS